MPDFERSLPPLATLVAFEAAHRHRNFSRAADELHQSQATVSRRVRELESDLGVSLFERRRHSVHPTTLGDELAKSVRLSLGELSTSAARIRRRSEVSESLTILCSQTLAPVTVGRVLGAFQQRHPAVNVRVISSCEHIESTVENFDVALQYGASNSDRFDVDFITDEAVFPVCAPSVAATVRSPLGAEELASLPLLHVEYDDPSWTTWPDFLGFFGLEVGPAETAMTFSSYRLCLDVAERGDGVALGWERSVAPRLDEGHLVRLPGLTMPSAGVINAYLPRSSPGREQAAEFIDLVKAELT